MMNSAPSLKAKAAAELELRRRRQQETTPLTVTDLRILDKRQQLIPLTLNRAQADFIANRTGRDLILKARQLGFSTVIQADIFTSAVNTTVSAGVLAHDDDTTQKLRRMQQIRYRITGSPCAPSITPRKRGIRPRNPLSTSGQLAVGKRDAAVPIIAFTVLKWRFGLMHAQSWPV